MAVSKKKRVLVLAGGPSSEHEVSLNTARMIMKHLDPKKYHASLAVIQKNGAWQFYPSTKALSFADALKKLSPKYFDFVFIAMHGAFGEDGRMQAILESVGLPYSGSGVLSSAVAMDKEMTNVLYNAHGFRVAKFVVMKKNARLARLSLTFPVVVKPASGGSSVGVSIVKSKKDLSKAISTALKEDERVMVQEYIKGREVTCGVLEGRDGKPFALPPTEIVPKVASFFDYKAKYKVGGSLEITPARITRTQTKELQSLALKAHQLLRCRGMSRSDFILKGPNFYILETNTIPGMTETSLLPQAAKAAGISFSAFLDLMIAIKKPRIG